MNPLQLFSAFTQGIAQAAKPRQIGQAMAEQTSPAATPNNREVGITLSKDLQTLPM